MYGVKQTKVPFNFMSVCSTSSAPIVNEFENNHVTIFITFIAYLCCFRHVIFIKFNDFHFAFQKLFFQGFLKSYLQCFLVSGCGATLTSPSGTITSPGHPSSYPHGANCTWYINVPVGNLVRLSFDSFNLEYHINCDFDYVEVYDNGTVETGNKLGRYCTTFISVLY